jgi:formate dehydrogenase subunit beta
MVCNLIQNKEIYYLSSSDEKLLKLGECGGALTTLMKFLLEKKIVDGVLAIKKGHDIYDAVPTLVCNPDELKDTAGSLHCGTLNIAKILVEYLDEVPDIKLAITVKPCEAETIVELGKHGKVHLENIIMIGVNCGGTFPPIPTINMIKNIFQVDADQVLNEEINRGKFIIESEDGSTKELDINQIEKGIYGRRNNCKRCEMNIPTSADLGFGNWGVIGNYEGKYSCVEIFSDLGAEILNKALEKGVLCVDKPSNESLHIRNQINKSMVNLAKKWQSNDFEKYEDDVKDILSSFNSYDYEFTKCIKCFGCRNACPICYCNECTLESSSPEWVDKGKIPPSPLFHLERLIHMVEFCTNCGQCEDVCPVDIPLSKIWHRLKIRIDELKYSTTLNKNDLILFDYFKRPG